MLLSFLFIHSRLFVILLFFHSHNFEGLCAAFFSGRIHMELLDRLLAIYCGLFYECVFNCLNIVS